MNKIVFFIIVVGNFIFSNVIIKGAIFDETGSPIPYANIYLKNTFDGISSNDKGQFSFTTYERG